MKTSFLKTAGIAAILLLVFAALTACAPAASTNAPAPAPTLAPTTAPAGSSTNNASSDPYGMPSMTSMPSMPAAAPTVAPAAAPQTGSAARISKVQFQNDMRKLWEDHITWTRLYIISALHDLPDKDAVAQRLLANQTDIGNAVKPFYGDAAGEKLTALLKDHILGAADLLAAAKSGDKAKVDEASKKWYANGDDIAVFLNSANDKNWPVATLKDMMKMHLDQTLQEAVHHMEGKYTEDIKDYDQIHEHILKMADALSGGIIAQFPDKFE